MKKQIKKILDIIVNNKLRQECIEFTEGSDCFIIKKLTNKYVIFKGCHYKTEIKLFFDLFDIDSFLLYYLLNKYPKNHIRINLEINVEVRQKKEKISEMEKERRIYELNKIIGETSMFDVSEYLGISIKESSKIFKKLGKEGKLKSK